MQQQQNYRRNIHQLHDLASLFWSSDLTQQEADLSIIPNLLQTQDQFIAILSVDVPSHIELFQILNASTMPANLFLKHLCILADVGGERLQRYNSEFKSLFPENLISYIHNTQTLTYEFKVLPLKGSLNNKRLSIDGKTLFQVKPLDDLIKDVIIILTFGSSCDYPATADTLARCEIGNYIGNHDKLETFVKQRYIWVSKITAGAQANTLGQIAQQFVKDHLKRKFPSLDFSKNRIPGVMHNEKRLTSFDIVISDGTKYIAVEVSFQVTTNSVIERKAGQAKSRFDQIEALGYKIAYVLDGAGNFERESAVSTICDYSHCNVAFTSSELDVLASFIKEYFGL